MMSAGFKFPVRSAVSLPRLLFLVLWIACAAVLSGWLTWHIQSAVENHRRDDLQAWCDRRARSLAQHFRNTHFVVEVRDEGDFCGAYK